MIGSLTPGLYIFPAAMVSPSDSSIFWEKRIGQVHLYNAPHLLSNISCKNRVLPLILP